MYEYFFTFGSITGAQSAVRELNRYSIPAKILRTPHLIQSQGCGHSISVRSGYFLQARDELDRLKLPYKKIYCKLPDGSFEEVMA